MKIIDMIYEEMILEFIREIVNILFIEEFSKKRFVIIMIKYEISEGLLKRRL